MAVLAALVVLVLFVTACDWPTRPAGVVENVASTSVTWGLDATPPVADWQRPNRLARYEDPIYGTSVRRMTSADGTRFDRNTYSRRQPENADGSRFMTYHGSAAYHVHDRVTGELVRALDIHPDAEPQWHPTDPDVIRHVAGPSASTGDLRYHEIDVETGARTVVADLTDRVRRVLPTAVYMIDRAEGSPSMDGSRSAWIVHDRDGDQIGVVSYDLASDRVLGILSSFERGVGQLDWVSMSPSGRYVMAGYWDRAVVYDADLTNRRVAFEGGEHSDIARGADGSDVYVYIDFTASSNGGWLMAVDLDTLAERRLFDLYDDANTSIHVSGKGYDRPGWVVVSTYNCKEPGAWSCEKVMAVELATGRVLNLAHTYNCGDEYWTETHAAVNRSFTRVYFNSDGGSCGIDAEVYELTIPAFE